MPGEVPEHLLRRSAERRRALGLPVPGEEGGAAAPRRHRPRHAAEAAEAAAAEAPAAGRGRRAGGPPDRRRRLEDPRPPAGPLRRPPGGQGRRRSAGAPAAGGQGARRHRRPGRRRHRRRAALDRHRPRGPHPAAADRRQGRLHPADPGRGPGQGPRLAPPAGRRVRGHAQPHGAGHDLLRPRPGAAAGTGQLQPDAEPVEGAVVLPRPPGAPHDLAPDGGRRDHPRHGPASC